MKIAVDQSQRNYSPTIQGVIYLNSYNVLSKRRILNKGYDTRQITVMDLLARTTNNISELDEKLKDEVKSINNNCMNYLNFDYSQDFSSSGENFNYLLMMKRIPSKNSKVFQPAFRNWLNSYKFNNNLDLKCI